MPLIFLGQTVLYVSRARKRLGNNVFVRGFPRNISLEIDVCACLIKEIQPTRLQNLVNIVSSARKQGETFVAETMFRANGETFRETCFRNNFSATMFPRLQGPLETPNFASEKTQNYFVLYCLS